MGEPGMKPCCLCGLAEDDQLKYGQVFRVDGLTVHHFCMLFSPNLAQNGKDDEGAEGFLAVDIRKEIARSNGTSCCYCSKPGATGLCMSMKCKKHYHPSCAVGANGLLQFFGQFKSFCEEHRPRQNVMGRELAESCSICLERTDPQDDHHVLWTPCCRHFFHRACLQRMAYHFGYFFYCPGCRNKDNISGFLKHMRHFGIFIPKRDASWELVPNAFGELLERHLVCDVRYCLCSQGRSHQENDADSPWRLCVCSTCGSAGTHVACSDLPETVTDWVCPSCTLEPPPAGAAPKSSLREFIAKRAPPGAVQPQAPAPTTQPAGEGSSSGPAPPPAPPLNVLFSLREILSELEEPERLVKFTVNPLSGLSVQTRPVSGARLAAREPGRRPVAFCAEELLPEAVVSVDEQAQAELRLWSENHVAATEAGGQSGYSAARRRTAAGPPRARPPVAEVGDGGGGGEGGGGSRDGEVSGEAGGDGEEGGGDGGDGGDSGAGVTGGGVTGSAVGSGTDGNGTGVSTSGGLSRWAVRVAASNAAPRPSASERQRLQLADLPPAAELHAALSALQCPGCRADFRLLSELTYHYQTHSGEPLFYCRICQQATSQWGSYHVLDHHPDLRAEEWTAYVDSNFQQAQALMVRLLLHRRNIKVTLEQSKTIAGNLKLILASRDAVGGQSSAAGAVTAPGPARERTSVGSATDVDICHYVCDQCGAVIRTHVAAASHKFFHTEEARVKYADRPHHCASCHFGSSQQYLVTRHRTLHHRAAPEAPSTPAAVATPPSRPAPAAVQLPSPDAPILAAALTPATPAARPTPGVLSGPLPATRVPPLAVMTSMVSESAVEATVMSSGKCKCPHCGKTTKGSQTMRVHLYWHTAEAERAQRSMAYHCPMCYFAANRGQLMSRHIEKIHKQDPRKYKRACRECQRPMYHPQRHNCLPHNQTNNLVPGGKPHKNKTGSPLASKIKRSTSPRLALTISGEKIPMPFPVPLVSGSSRDGDHSCKLCGKRGTREAVRMHQNFHTVEYERKGRSRPAHCPLCFFSADSSNVVAKHLQVTHVMTPATFATVCSQCGITVYNAEAHARYHRGRGEGLPGADDDFVESNPPQTPTGTLTPQKPHTPQSSQKSTPQKAQTPLKTVASPVAPAPGASGGGRLVAAGSLIACGNSDIRRDCPFCDAFFDSKRMYDRHMVLNHLVGAAETRNIACRFRYCCAESSPTHTKLFHKGSEERAFRCSQCDSTYTSGDDLRAHTARQHADESVPAFELREDGHCWCSNLSGSGALANVKFHLIAYHSVLIRGYPGPRAAPYACPKCPAQLEYHELLEHLQTQHDWVFSPGDEYRGPGRPRDMEVGCPLCHRTASFERLFQHMQEKHQWRFLESRQGAKERGNQVVRPASSAVTTAGKLAAAASRAPAEGGVTIYDCPFCDAFFESKSEYALHGRKFHSGLEVIQNPNGLEMCTMRYCYMFRASRHDFHCHKNFAERTARCDQCDGAFHSIGYVKKHQRMTHAVTHPPRMVMGKLLCVCDFKKTNLNEHLWMHHFDSLRLPPGPRPEPYWCPECGVSMVFDQLTTHLTQEHCWRLKETGTDVFKINAGVVKARGRSLFPLFPKLSMPATSPVKSPTKPPSLSLPSPTASPSASKAASKAVASLPQSVSVTALPPTVPPPMLSPQLDAARAFSGRHKISELAEDTSRLDCPFCDAFFLARNRYMRHMRLAHSGSNGITESSCTFRYCYNMAAPSTTDKHISTFHKGASVLVLKCSFCDRMCRNDRSINGHTELTHKSQMERGVQVGDVAECVCDAIGSENDSKSLLWLHFVKNHSVQVRSYPGPRSRPYDCPVCSQRFEFSILVEHLRLEHMWRIKDDGEEAFGLNRLDNRNFFDSITVLQPTGSGVAGHRTPSKAPAAPATVIASPAASTAPATATTPRSVSELRRQTEAAKHSDEVNRAMASVIPCPFCDFFFDTKVEYERHALTIHSGLTQAANMCPVRYCCAIADPKHFAHYHKTLLPIRCRSCDAGFRGRSVFNKHILRAHKWVVNRSNAENPLHRLCSCSVGNPSGVHMHACHSFSVRGTPGPREEPYLCPMDGCDLQLKFEALLDHLVAEHQWRPKTQGDNPYRRMPPKSTSSARPPGKRVVMPQTTLVKRKNPGNFSKLRFRCHYCGIPGSKDEVRLHQETAHRETHQAFIKFARSCHKRGVYMCPHCPYKRDRIWTFRRHLARSAACRHRIGPSADPWLNEPEIEPEPEDEQEEPSETEEAQHVAPLKIKLWGTDSGARRGSLDSTSDSTAADTAGADDGDSTPTTSSTRPSRRAKKPTRNWRPAEVAPAILFYCHFCLLRGSRGAMKEHMLEKHGEAYNTYVAFGNSNRVNIAKGAKGAIAPRTRFCCPGCTYSTDQLWLLMPHIAHSACAAQMGPEHQVWISQCPHPDTNPYCRGRNVLPPKVLPLKAGTGGVKQEPVMETADAREAAEFDDVAATVEDADVEQAGVPETDPLDISSSDTSSLPPGPKRSKTLPPTKKKKTLSPKQMDHCRYCGLVAGKMEIWRHYRMTHSDQHADFLAWVASCSDDMTNMKANMTCPRAGCPFRTRDKWGLRSHVSQEALCRHAVNGDPQWLMQAGQVKVEAEEREDVVAVEDSEGEAEAEALFVADEDDDETDGQDSQESARDKPGSSAAPEPVTPRAPAPTATPGSSVQSPATFECLKCSASFSDKAQLIAHSQSMHSVRKKRPLTPDSTQPRIDSFFKRAKVE